ncbi:hypothetical protein GFS60_07414 (plasmid) [Rhodococcus sp. WAY2]|nr:hypothetical protein GFS60_07414 [Rhodococcus sp. WAY2]
MIERRLEITPSAQAAGGEGALKKCPQVETDRGGHTVRLEMNEQVVASRNVIGRETLMGVDQRAFVG